MSEKSKEVALSDLEKMKHAIIKQHNLISQLKFAGDDVLIVAEIMKEGLAAVDLFENEPAKK